MSKYSMNKFERVLIFYFDIDAKIDKEKTFDETIRYKY